MPDTLIPVKLRTARKQHTCGQCHKPILPGDQYEDHRLPPGGELGNTSWWPMKIHAPRERNGCYTYGCDMAAARREQNRRMRSRALAVASMPIGQDLDLLCAATRVVVTAQNAGPAIIQRKVRVGFAKAGHLCLLLQEYGVIGPVGADGKYPVLVLPWDLNSALFDLCKCSEEEPRRG